ncbi:DUF934 domain-containing protein [Pseudochrobactrum sp. HB0163]|uniref:DUF934 domain-containing protein n=1 Tax=Pseudochrobactrum sp. HB0163 TaxID=3450708 RepID=UPI003F6DF090
MTGTANVPVLWTRAGVTTDIFTPVEAVEDMAGHNAVIVPLTLWPQIRAAGLHSCNIRIGVRVEAGEVLDSLLADLTLVEMIGLNFPAFNDGRSFSKAVRLRSHYGFGGEIRAMGAVHIDQVSAMLRAGFDALEIGDELTLQRLLAGELHDSGRYYQPAAGAVLGAEQPLAGYSWRRQAI